MRTILVTGSDTGVGKTHVVAAIARLLARDGASVQIVKVVETGRAIDVEGDAQRALKLAGVPATAHTLASFQAALAPAAAATLEGVRLTCESHIAAARLLPPSDWRIYEGAGGIATPVDDAGRDWADFAVAAGIDALVVVVPDRLGAINQARLTMLRAEATGIPAGVWLNRIGPVDAPVAESTRAGLRSVAVPIWGEQEYQATEPTDAVAALHALKSRGQDSPEPHSPDAAEARTVAQRCREFLTQRAADNLRRTLRVTRLTSSTLNLADNDYLALARDPIIASAVAQAAVNHGTSASASPLITGWQAPHAQLVETLCAWHGFPRGLLWSSGYAANAAVLGGLPRSGDIVFADRLIHASMIAGLRRSGARLQRYEHLDLARLESLLARHSRDERQVFVVTETLFSMDGDYPDLARMAELKRRYGFFWVVDEAHALGWYGPRGAGLVVAAGVAQDVDILVGTFGKALASGGAYVLIRDEAVADTLVNSAGEFIYSTSLPPTTVAAAHAALERAATLAVEQPHWYAMSRSFRRRLREAGWETLDGDAPIVPVVLHDPAAALAMADRLRDAGILVGAVRPPTVPAGTSRLRVSLKRTLTERDIDRVIAALGEAPRSDAAGVRRPQSEKSDLVHLRQGFPLRQAYGGHDGGQGGAPGGGPLHRDGSGLCGGQLHGTDEP